MAQGFVRKGFNLVEIVTRLQKVNEKQCAPPLPDDELRELASRAHSYGTPGTLNLDYRFLDSSFQSLSFGAAKLAIVTRRISNGNPGVSFSLLPQEMKKWGFGNHKTLGKYRDELIDNNLLLIHRPALYGRNGATRECGLFRIS